MTWTRSALQSALVASAVAAAAGLVGGAVRLLPWLLDPEVTFRVAAPFARSLAVVAGEAALAVGWPIGWALATQAYVERGEARVHSLLGEPPARTARRLSRQGVVLGAMLLGLSLASGRESGEPGRVVSELISEGQTACLRTDHPRTYSVPFFGAAWLCAPGATPRLAGQGPGRLASLVFSAANARASGDMGHINLDDATLALPRLSVHVGSLSLHGATPWGHAEAVTPLSRATALTVAVALSAWATVVLILRGAGRGRIAALLLGGAGPLTALGGLRVVERIAASDASRSLLTAMVPIASICAPILVAAGLAWLASRLPAQGQAASK